MKKNYANDERQTDGDRENERPLTCCNNIQMLNWHHHTVSFSTNSERHQIQGILVWTIQYWNFLCFFLSLSFSMISMIKAQVTRFTYRFILMRCCFCCCAVCVSLPHNTKCHSIPILFVCVCVSLSHNQLIFIYILFFIIFNFTIIQSQWDNSRIYTYMRTVHIIIIWVLVKRHLQQLKEKKRRCGITCTHCKLVTVWTFTYWVRLCIRVRAHTHASSNEIEVLVYLFSVFLSVFSPLALPLCECVTLSLSSFTSTWSCTRWIVLSKNKTKRLSVCLNLEIYLEISSLAKLFLVFFSYFRCCHYYYNFVSLFVWSISFYCSFMESFIQQNAHSVW